MEVLFHTCALIFLTLYLSYSFSHFYSLSPIQTHTHTHTHREKLLGHELSLVKDYCLPDDRNQTISDGRLGGGLNNVWGYLLILTLIVCTALILWVMLLRQPGVERLEIDKQSLIGEGAHEGEI